MTRVVDAIYTNGHLEPVEPLDLAERERVTLVVHTHEPVDTTKQDAALKALFELMDRSQFRSGGRFPSRDELHERR